MISLIEAKREPGEEEEVTRAKYFIRDEFLVSTLDIFIRFATLFLLASFHTYLDSFLGLLYFHCVSDNILYKN